MVLVDLALATICFMSNGAEICAPALVGPQTPKGEYTLQQRLTESPGYGGDVLQFHETPKYVMAIHRVWILRPKERRAERLSSGDVKQRTSITNGCINVTPEVYKLLLNCCYDSVLIVK